MPEYQFRCNDCGRRFSLHYSTVKEYDDARPSCDSCESTDLARVITHVSLSKSDRDFSRMTSGEMLSVLESGDQRQVDSLFKQVGAATAKPSSGKSDYANADGAATKPKADRAAPGSPSSSDRG